VGTRFSFGSIVVTRLIKIKIIPVADNTPNFLVISHEVNNIKDRRNGKHNVAGRD
jgi:hypothetical protein